MVRGDRARHLARVVRIRPGEALEVSDGRRAFVGEVLSSAADEVVIKLGEPLPAPTAAPRVELLFSIIKFPRWETGLEKATEAGADRIVPVIAERTDGGLARGAEKKLERWRTIAEEAAQQSRRLAAPEVSEPEELREALGRPAERRYFLDFGGQPLDEALVPCPSDARVSVLVGPEGGWSDAEREAAAAAGWTAVRLGDTVLRAETAAIVAVALIRQLTREGRV